MSRKSIKNFAHSTQIRIIFIYESSAVYSRWLFPRSSSTMTYNVYGIVTKYDNNTMSKDRKSKGRKKNTYIIIGRTRTALAQQLFCRCCCCPVVRVIYERHCCRTIMNYYYYYCLSYTVAHVL